MTEQELNEEAGRWLEDMWREDDERERRLMDELNGEYEIEPDHDRDEPNL